MVRSPSSLLFGVVLTLSFALVVWWTWFQLGASAELVAAGERLAASDVAGAARALGAGAADAVADLGHRRRAMFASEGAFFAIVLLALGWLYLASVRREARLLQIRDRFLAAATHELKTPLATIGLLLESLRDNRVPAEKRARYLATGLLEAERLGRGLDNVLTAAGLRTTQPAMRWQAGDLPRDLGEALEAVRGRAEAAAVGLELDCPPQLPWQRDPAAIQLVLRNLLDNAVKYSLPDPRVVVTVSRTNSGRVRIAVADNGPGIPIPLRPLIFRRFHRLGSELERSTPGTGLGLFLVKALVRQMRGKVLVRGRQPPPGTVFEVELPAAARLPG